MKIVLTYVHAQRTLNTWYSGSCEVVARWWVKLSTGDRTENFNETETIVVHTYILYDYNTFSMRVSYTAISGIHNTKRVYYNNYAGIFAGKKIQCGEKPQWWQWYRTRICIHCTHVCIYKRGAADFQCEKSNINKRPSRELLRIYIRTRKRSEPSPPFYCFIKSEWGFSALFGVSSSILCKTLLNRARLWLKEREGKRNDLVATGCRRGKDVTLGRRGRKGKHELGSKSPGFKNKPKKDVLYY